MSTFNIEEYLNSLPEDTIVIDLSGKNLTYLPNLSRFKNLQKLHISVNEFPESSDDELPEILNAEQRNVANRFIKCRFRIMCLKYKRHFRRWLWERVRLPKIERDYHPDKLLEVLNKMENPEDEEAFMEAIESW